MTKLFTAKLMVAYLIGLFAVTLGGFYRADATRNLVPLRTMEHDIRAGGSSFVINFLGNVAVTVPMGLMLAVLLGRRCSMPRVAAICLSTSLVIEVLQGLSGKRVADVDDVILNTLGGVIGWGLWVAGRRWLAPRTDQVDPDQSPGTSA